MSKKIKITESQLKQLMENNKKPMKEQFDDYDSPEYDEGSDRDNWEDEQVFRDNELNTEYEETEPEDGFPTTEKLLHHASQLLEIAMKQTNWTIVEEVINDIREFLHKNEKISDQSSVLDDTPEEHDERNYGINETINKIKFNFKRFL